MRKRASFIMREVYPLVFLSAIFDASFFGVVCDTAIGSEDSQGMLRRVIRNVKKREPPLSK